MESPKLIEQRDRVKSTRSKEIIYNGQLEEKASRQCICVLYKNKEEWYDDNKNCKHKKKMFTPEHCPYQMKEDLL